MLLSRYVRSGISRNFLRLSAIESLFLRICLLILLRKFESVRYEVDVLLIR